MKIIPTDIYIFYIFYKFYAYRIVLLQNAIFIKKHQLRLYYLEKKLILWFPQKQKRYLKTHRFFTFNITTLQFCVMLDNIWQNGARTSLILKRYYTAIDFCNYFFLAARAGFGVSAGYLPCLNRGNLAIFEQPPETFISAKIHDLDTSKYIYL